MDRDSLCPKCLRLFTGSRGVLAHLTHRLSSCYGFLEDYHGLSTFVEEDTRWRAQRAQERAHRAFQNHDLEPAPPAPPASIPAPTPPTPSHINTTATEYHPHSSFTYGQTANMFERIASDGFAHRRVDNPYYPFRGREEWGLARFLASSSLSQSEIDDFLKQEWVTPFQSPLLNLTYTLGVGSTPEPDVHLCSRTPVVGRVTSRSSTLVL